MIGHRTLLSLCVVGALAISAVTASGSAAVTGYKAFTCKKVGPGGNFKKAHCKKEDAGSGEWTHQPPTTPTNTAITITNANNGFETKTTVELRERGKIAGLETEVVCKGVSSEGGTLSNKTNGEENYVHADVILKYTECSVTKPAGRNCVVTGGAITTNQLTATTENQGMSILIKPKEGTTFTTIPISNCLNNIPPTNNYPVAGSFKVTEIEVDGSTFFVSHEEVTTQGGFTFGGQPSGLDGAVTLKGPSGDGLSFTTPPYTE